MELISAYAECERITGEQAKNFSYGIRLLPTDKRAAMSALYAFARRVDDIGDGDLPVGAKEVQLAQARADVENLAEGAGTTRDDDAVLVALADTTRRYGLPVGALHELIDGMAMDVVGTHYTTADELVRYCRCVAGSIGRLSLAIFGSDDPEAPELADALGVALQLTNILRDVVEDRLMGRVYVPEVDLERFGCDEALTCGDVVGLLRYQADRAEEWFSRGLGLLPLVDRRSRACVAAMSGIYHQLLHRMAAEPSGVLAGRLSLSTWQKSVVACRSLVGALR
jgi:phytoene synthase